jgi:hypothetical protein
MVHSAKKRPLLPLVTKRELYDDMMRLMNVNGPHLSMLYDKSFDSRQPFTSDSYEAHFREMNILVYRMEAVWISNNQHGLCRAMHSIMMCFHHEAVYNGALGKSINL